ncbi:hypothetical protein LOCC1_G008502 [Lachnellula occidentalis]|uniref:Uncharacterized protein n=1 Tax=Lachnellula occidentalis TaxID=215460 RepID=A0A8H8U3Z9_9HELO|nr:hypothetical protein LOCC1_G008502 [Lachnellula occidentalis]
MGLDNVTSFSETDSSTAYTPPSSVAEATLDALDPLKHFAPSPGPTNSTFIIRCRSSGHVLTLLNGAILLAPPGGRATIHWTCVETKGWLGFQNYTSGKFLGYGEKHGLLRCVADRQQEWESFCVRLRPDGGYVLLMTDWERLLHVGMKMVGGVEALAKVGEGAESGIAWGFVKV